MNYFKRFVVETGARVTRQAMIDDSTTNHQGGQL
jgi:hypothetical protein